MPGILRSELLARPRNTISGFCIAGKDESDRHRAWPLQFVQPDTAPTDKSARSQFLPRAAAPARGRRMSASGSDPPPASAGAGVCVPFKWVRLWSSALRVGRRGCGRTDLEPGPIAVWLSDSELPPGINPGGSQSSTACARGGQPQPLANHAPRRASRGDGQRAVGGCGVVGDDQRRDGAHSGREIADRRPSR
jgi:hypothetical protein